MATKEAKLPGAYGRDFGSKEKIQDTESVCATLQATMGVGGGNTPIIKQVAQTYPNSGNPYSPSLRSERSGLKVVEPVNPMPDGTCRTLKHQYYKTSNANYKRTGSMGATGVDDGQKIRKLTPRECWRLMGFSDSDFEKAKSAGISNTQLYKQAGNSIVTNVLYYIFKELYVAMPYLFEDLKVGSYFSGIGAFEIGLNRLYEDINSGNFTKPQRT